MQPENDKPGVHQGATDLEQLKRAMLRTVMYYVLSVLGAVLVVIAVIQIIQVVLLFR